MMEIEIYKSEGETRTEFELFLDDDSSFIGVFVESYDEAGVLVEYIIWESKGPSGLEEDDIIEMIHSQIR